MRTFNEFEKSVLSLMLKQNNIKSTHKLISEILGVEFWGWAKDYKRIFYPVKTSEEEEVNVLRGQFLDILALFDYLEVNFIVSFYGLDDSELLVIKDCIINDSPAFVVSSDGREIKEEDFGDYFCDDPASIGRKIEYYTNSMFHVTQTLKELVNNDFKTIEQRNFEKQLEDADKKHSEQMAKAEKSLCYSQRSFVIALIALIASVGFNIYSCCSDIKRSDLNNTLKEQKLPNVISVKIINDTLKTIVVDH
jgi:hypothetical protein